MSKQDFTLYPYYLTIFINTTDVLMSYSLGSALLTLTYNLVIRV